MDLAECEGAEMITWKTSPNYSNVSDARTVLSTRKISLDNNVQKLHRAAGRALLNCHIYLSFFHC